MYRVEWGVTDNSDRYTFWLRTFFFLVTLALIFRAFQLQVAQGDYLLLESVANATREVKIPAKRGLILDRNGTVLVGNQARFSISLLPESPLEAEELRAQVYDLLDPSHRGSEGTELSHDVLETLIFKENLTPTEIARVAELQGLHPGVILEEASARNYLCGQSLGHVIGYVGYPNDDEVEQRKDSKPVVPGEQIGKDGVELYFDKEFRGEPGRKVYEVDVYGEVVKVLERENPVAGADLQLSLDLEYQRSVEQMLKQAVMGIQGKGNQEVAGSVVVMDCATGEVLAMASFPTYDPRWFSERGHDEKITRLFQDKRAPMFNRTIHTALPPASTMKLVTTVASLAEGQAALNSSWYCPGYELIGERKFYCFNTAGHGQIDFKEGIAQSCDVIYYQLGLKLKDQGLSRWDHRFGLGTPLGIELPGEVGGFIPTADWKEKELKERWFPGDSANSAIGQGFVTATPLQMARVVCGIVNNGAFPKPTVLKQKIEEVELVTPPGFAEIDPKVWAFLKSSMRAVVDHGTARGIDSNLVNIAGKTGTAESVVSDYNPKGENHTWFVGYADIAQPVAVAVCLEKSGGYGGQSSARIAKKALERWVQFQNKK